MEKILGGTDKLADKITDKIQNYYGMAIRSNLDCVEKGYLCHLCL